MFEPQKYWEDRLFSNFSLFGVGDITLGKYNTYLYKIRKFAFSRIVSKLKLEYRDLSVADIGPGTGFYINLWCEKGIRKISGYDITHFSVEKLKKLYTGSNFYFEQMDISEIGSVLKDKPDIISAFDVLYHIVDNERYIRAFSNLNKSLKTGGYLIFSENLIKSTKGFKTKHQVCRSSDFILETLYKAGFEIEFIRPMFYFMNTSFNAKKLIQKYAFPLISRLIYKFKFLSGFIGFIIYPIELIYISIKRESYSTEIIVCKKIADV